MSSIVDQLTESISQLTIDSDESNKMVTLEDGRVVPESQYFCICTDDDDCKRYHNLKVCLYDMEDRCKFKACKNIHPRCTAKYTFEIVVDGKPFQFYWMEQPKIISTREPTTTLIQEVSAPNTYVRRVKPAEVKFDDSELQARYTKAVKSKNWAEKKELIASFDKDINETKDEILILHETIKLQTERLKNMEAAVRVLNKNSH